MAQHMTYAAHGKAVLTLGLPLIGGHLGQVAIQITDTVMLGWYGVEALAAVVLASSYFFILFIVGAGFAWAVMPMVAAAAEADDTVQIRRITRMGLWLSLLFAMAAIPLMLFSGPVLVFLGQEPALAADAQSYLSILGWGMIPAIGVMVLKSYLAALERTRIVLWMTLAAAILNAALNYVLIFGNFGAPELGVRGAAIASLAMHGLSVIVIIVYARAVFPEHALFVRLWRPDWEAFRSVFQLGWPIGLTSLAESGLFIATAIMMGWLGTLPLAAHGIALQIASLTFMIHLGLANAATVRAGRAHGRMDPDHLRRGGVVVIAMSMVFSALTIFAFLTWPELWIGLFLSPDAEARPQLLAIGVSLLAMAALFQLADGLQVLALGLLRGVQDTRAPMIMAGVSYWGCGMPASYYLGFTLGWGGVGVWLGLVIGLALAAALLMWRFWMRPSWSRVAPA
ncbi:MATE family efflux transporter [Actibacterium sp. 188UL27-1]|uniref:MATE family efflux transporter n=1 Tax=Actibacterium sp. 188UL27-1 TaxID=2786961 RepID=UPI00195C99C4|nr:MATE family efflux transporter [Actibacterium sp. 188UL27-1]MBM7066868.1 MATE family efflux transporter [Actibacterium sp. 188UL27-1]